MIADSFNSMADYLEERRRDQLRFIASIAHDFRNPLNAMSVAARLLLDKSPEETREVTASILRQVRNLDHLLTDLLDTTRIEAGQFTLDFSVLDIASLVRDVVALHRSWPVPHEIDLDAPDTPLLCLGDESRLSQVLNNLLSNALKYSPGGSMVEVSAAKRGEEVILKVADQGIGIAGDERETIFMPFRRSAATRGTIPGIGLGLSASRRIVEAHGGRIEVESTLGRGSTFTVHLPVHPDSRKAFQPGGE
jgi:signal transduction histidine kinase